MRILMNHPIEIRTINLKPGTREEFQRLYIEEALPRLKCWNFDVVAITAWIETPASALKPAEADS
jgi:hypothetical protein